MSDEARFHNLKNENPQVKRATTTPAKRILANNKIGQANLKAKDASELKAAHK